MSAIWIRGTYNGSKSDGLNHSRPQPKVFDIGYSDRPASPVMAHAGRGPNLVLDTQRFATGDLQSLQDKAQSAATQYVSDAFESALGHYAQDGIALGEEIVDRAAKAYAVAEAAGTGAAIGAMIPVLGEIGVGEVAGALVAGIYSAIDNFGGDISALFNPPDFSDDDYTRMKKNCIISGGVPNWGRAPDNEDGCIYPDGTTSGGDYPRHPPPGVQSIRGDDYFDYDAFFAAHPTLKPGYVKLLSSKSLARAGTAIANRDAALANQAKIKPLSSSLLTRLVPLLQQVQKPVLTPISTSALLSAGAKKAIAAKLTPVATTVANAMAGNDAAKVAVRSTVDAARSGDASAINDARNMTHAQRLIMLNTFKTYYLAHAPQAAALVRTAGVSTNCACNQH